MTQSYSVSLEKIITAHNLEIIYLPKPADEILITTNEVNRPGIVMTGYTCLLYTSPSPRDTR